jgi:SP family facilitated glucose transporter-like MFS transporter 8
LSSPSSFILGIGSVAFGYIMVYQPYAYHEWGTLFPSIPDAGLAFFAAVISLTGITGLYITNWLLSPRCPLGMRTVIFILAFTGTGFWLITLAITETLFWIGIISCVLLDITVGGLGVIIPLYIIEVSRHEITAFFRSIHQIGVAVGFVLLYLLSNWFTWKEVAIGGGIITFLLGLFVWFVLPSGQAAVDPDETVKESSCQGIWIPKILLGVLIVFFQQLSGINAILGNFHGIFEEANVNLKLGIATVIVGIAQVISGLFANFLIAALGGRVIWVLSFGGIAITNIGFGITEMEYFKEKVPAAILIVIQ